MRRRRRPLGRGALCALALMCGAFAPIVHAAQATASARAAAFAALPDWTGLWEMGRPGGGPRSGQPPPEPPGELPAGPGPRGAPIPYNDEWQAKYAATRARLAAMSGREQFPDSTVTRCTWGIPRLFNGPYQFEITVTPGLTFLNYDVREFRHIYTDGRGHPPEAQRQPWRTGHSIGRWQGAELLIETVGILPQLWINGEGATLSAEARVTERWWQPERDRLAVEVTVDDPLALRAPYRYSNTYRRIADTNRIVQQNCYENTHEVQQDGRVVTEFWAERAR